jgi:hypothetical protein
MPWFKASDVQPADGERVLIHDDANERVGLGRYAAGRWYVEDPAGVRLGEVEGVTSWAPLLESEEYDPAED